MLLTILVVAFFYALSQRSALTVDVIRDRNALYREVGDGYIENSYQLKLINKTDSTHTYDIAVSGIDGARVEVPTGAIRVPSGEVLGRATSQPMRMPAMPCALEKVRDTSTRSDSSARGIWVVWPGSVT